MWYKDVRKGFGLTLKKWRGTTGISQEELAWRAGLHRSYVADIERGARNASGLGADAYIVKPVDFHRFSEVTPNLDFAWTLLQGPAKGGASRREGSRAPSA